MSLFLDTLNTVHDKQLKAAARSTDLLASTAGKVAALAEGARDKAPKAPAAVAGPLGKVTAPVTKVVGTPTEVAGYTVRSVRDWAAVQQRFAGAALAPFLPATQE